MLASAISLRDPKGRGRVQALTSMAGAWRVVRYEQLDGKREDRTLAALAKGIKTAVWDAFLCWERRAAAE